MLCARTNSAGSSAVGGRLKLHGRRLHAGQQLRRLILRAARRLFHAVQQPAGGGLRGGEAAVRRLPQAARRLQQPRPDVIEARGEARDCAVAAVQQPGGGALDRVQQPRSGVLRRRDRGLRAVCSKGDNMSGQSEVNSVPHVHAFPADSCTFDVIKARRAPVICDKASGPESGAASRAEGALWSRTPLPEPAPALSLLAACDGSSLPLCCALCTAPLACSLKLCIAELAACFAAGGSGAGVLCAALSAACLAELKAFLAAEPACCASCGACTAEPATRSAAAPDLGACSMALLAALPADCAVDNSACQMRWCAR